MPSETPYRKPAMVSMRLLGKPTTRHTAWAMTKTTIPFEPCAFSHAYGDSRNADPYTTKTSDNPTTTLAKKHKISRWDVHLSGGRRRHEVFGRWVSRPFEINWSRSSDEMSVRAPAGACGCVGVPALQGVVMVLWLASGRVWGLFDTCATFEAGGDARKEFYTKRT